MHRNVIAWRKCLSFITKFVEFSAHISAFVASSVSLFSLYLGEKVSPIILCSLATSNARVRVLEKIIETITM